MEGSKFDVSNRLIAHFSRVVIEFVQELCHDMCRAWLPGDKCRESLNQFDRGETVNKSQLQNEGVEEANRLQIHNEWIESGFGTKGRKSRRVSPPN